ncbi:SMC4 [Enterospora canceri]|uniref:SMC4 n=1 Tax=Enterospora canceri TaxID=1081671 RepID=A0A1Y1S6F4_9MICR|nr:SMC4 [Enterospora canceri]
MLRLSSIKIHNFKSYLGTHEVTGLSDTITAIVGPNGCGKSNIIDAIIFVLGYNAKKMRHNTLRDLIYKGMDSAWVELILNRNDTMITLCRKIGKNGSSKYHVDGIIKDDVEVSGEVQSKQYNEILKELGINTTYSKFLILQGEIESIALMNQMELLNYIEDSIGTGCYRDEIEEQEKEVQRLNEMVQNKMEENAFITNEYEFIKKQVISNCIQVKDEEKSVEKEKKEMEKKKKKIGDRINKNNSAISGIETELDKLTRDIEDRKKEMKKAIKEKKLVEVEQEYRSVKDELKREESRNRNKNDKMREIQAKIDEIDEIERNKETLRTITRERDENKTKLNMQKKTPIETRYLEEKLEQLTRGIEEENRIETKKEIYRQRIQENTEYIDKARKVERNKNELKIEIDQIKRDLKATANELQKRRRYNNENSKVDYLYRKQRDVIHAIKHLDGFVGQFRELLEVEEGYETAVEAASNQLNSIVVKTTSTAEEAIRIILSSNMIRTTFLVLDKFNNTNIDQLNKLSIVHKIKTNKMYRNILHKTLGNTLVADDLEQGRRLAFGSKRERVVTKDGKVLEKSGIMSGGGTTTRRKPVQELIDAEKKMRTVLNEKEQEVHILTEIENKKVEIERFKIEMTKLTNKPINQEIQGRLNEIRKIREEIESIRMKNEECNQLLREITIAERRNVIIEREISKIEKESATLPDLQNMISKHQCEISTEIKLQNKLTKITECYNNLQNEYQSKIDHNKLINSEVEEMMRTVIENQVKKSELVKEIKQHETESAKISLNIDQLNSELSKLNSIINELEQLEKSPDSENSRPDGIHISLNQIQNNITKFKLIKAEFTKFTNALESDRHKLNHLKSTLQSTRDTRLTKFTAAFGAINRSINGIFSRLTFGGCAELDLVNFLDPFSDGIQLQIMPRKKAWKSISNLSGGEKTLSSLSLVFALHQHSPSPFYIMDEIDAALDYKNVSLISSYLQEISAQFIVISLRNDMFEGAETLVGVYKTNEQSKLVKMDI